ncbi:MAG: T9SS type A sorting domain-containing protein [Bacteroidales bacterium]|nr:T9SS type A sorting domain-containing protein [Bacteroidales bacterium]
MKKLFIFSLFSLFVVSLHAQSAVVPAGGTATGAGGTVTYTVGQIADQQVNGGDKYIIEGVQQPYEIQTVGVNEYPGITLEAVLFPNPTTSYVQLRITNYDMPAGGLTAQLYDANGKLLELFKITDLETMMDLSVYPTASYQLRIMEGSRMLKTFKVVKNKM